MAQGVQYIIGRILYPHINNALPTITISTSKYTANSFLFDIFGHYSNKFCSSVKSQQSCLCQSAASRAAKYSNTPFPFVTDHKTLSTDQKPKKVLGTGSLWKRFALLENKFRKQEE
jgi:hypothetical protein